MQTNFKPLCNPEKLTVATSVAGLGLAGYLTFLSLSSSGVVGCGGSGLLDCESVLTSHWSKVRGVPVSILALVTYCGLLGATIVARFLSDARIRDFASAFRGQLSIVAGLAATWFVGLQIFAVGKFCVFCLAAHICGLTLMFLGLRRSQQKTRQLSVAGVLIAGLALTQALSDEDTYIVETPPAATEEAEFELISPLNDDVESTSDESEADTQEVGSSNSERGDRTAAMLTLYSISHSRFVTQTVNMLTAIVPEGRQREGRVVRIGTSSVRVRSNEWPIVGSQTAGKILVEFIDYTCSHCRETSRTLKRIQQKDSNLAVIVMPVPLNSGCNDSVRVTPAGHENACELARLSIALWRVAPGKFKIFHSWLMSFQQTPRLEVARQKAFELAGKARVLKELHSGATQKYLQATVRIYKKLGGGSLPKLWFPKDTLVGRVTSEDAIEGLLRTNFQK